MFQFRRAQEVAGPTLPDTEACDLLLLLGAAEAGAGDWAASRHTFENAAALARTLDCPERFARAALGFKGMMWATNPADYTAIAMLEDSRSLLRPEHRALEVELLSAISRSLYYSREVDRARTYSKKALRLARLLRDDRLHAVALEAHTVCLLRPDTTPALHRSIDIFLGFAGRTRDPHLLFNAKIFKQLSHLIAGNIAEADLYLSEAATSWYSTPLW